MTTASVLNRSYGYFPTNDIQSTTDTVTPGSTQVDTHPYTPNTHRLVSISGSYPRTFSYA